MSIPVNLGEVLVPVADFGSAVHDYLNRTSNTHIDIASDVATSAQTLILTTQLVLNALKVSQISSTLGLVGAGVTTANLGIDYGKLLDAWTSHPPKIEQGYEAE